MRKLITIATLLSWLALHCCHLQVVAENIIINDVIVIIIKIIITNSDIAIAENELVKTV